MISKTTNLVMRSRLPTHLPGCSMTGSLRTAVSLSCSAFDRKSATSWYRSSSMPDISAFTTKNLGECYKIQVLPDIIFMGLKVNSANRCICGLVFLTKAHHDQQFTAAAKKVILQKAYQKHKTTKQEKFDRWSRL